MIDKTALKAFVEKQLEGTDLFLVGIDISPDNDITVEIDSDTSVDIDRCVGLTKEIEKEFDRDEEDYRLEVGSAGLTSPFKVLRQYEKNIGNEVEVITTGGKKFKGVLQSVGPESFSIISAEKIKHEGAKRPVLEDVRHDFTYPEVKSTKYLLQF